MGAALAVLHFGAELLRCVPPLPRRSEIFGGFASVGLAGGDVGAVHTETDQAVSEVFGIVALRLLGRQAVVLEDALAVDQS